MKRVLLLLAIVALLCGLAFSAAAGGAARRGPLHDLKRASPGRAFAPRLSIETEHRPCTPLPADSGGTVPREACGRHDDVPALAERLAAAGESADPDSLRASALAAVIWWDETEPSLDAAVAQLERALWIGGDSVPLLVDLSGVHLARAERMQSLRDLATGLQYAREALQLDSSNKPALFNAALALTRIGIDGEAARAWEAYLGADPSSRWADEARRRKAELPKHPTARPTLRPGASAPEVGAFAARHPLEARLLGWDHLLGQWGSAMEAGDRARADSVLALAEMLGSALERRRGGDATLADAVRSIRAAAPDPAATRALARAHRTYAAGQELYRKADYTTARDSFASVIAARPPSLTLVQWATVFRGGMSVVKKNNDVHGTVHGTFQALLSETDTVRHPALAARIRWSWGTGLLRDGEFEEARTHYLAAARGYERAGETEFRGAILNLIGESEYAQGNARAAYENMHRALLILRHYRDSIWLHSALMLFAHYATLDGMPLAGESILDEDVAITTKMRITPHNHVEALLTRARALAQAGRIELAVRDLEAAAPLVPQIQAKDPYRWFTAVLRFSRVVVAADADPTRSVAALDSSVADLADNVMWLLPTIVQRADAKLAKADLDGAIADLDTATARIRGLAQGLSYAYLRASMIEEARSHFDQLVMLHLRSGRPVEALRVLERGRVSFAPTAEIRAFADDRPLAAPPGQVAVEYALIGDQLLTWTVRDTSIRFLQRKVDRAGLLRAVERATYALETSAPVAVARPELERLYDALIRPIAGDLGAPETPLVILADGELAGVPFNALFDAKRNRYLLQDRPLRFATTLADAARPAPPADPARRALLVADPAFDRLANPKLDRLRGARTEAASLGALYPDHVLLATADATPGSLAAMASGASVIHYAGHAVFDDARPERSYLLLAGEGPSGRLSADSVAKLQLGGVRLVVLSACRTLRSRQGRSGGFAGLSGALLAAGAGGVVGSPWEVDDSLAQPLMLAFHREYRLAGDPARALRKAQLEMLHSGDSARASPAAWAGFRYAGR